MNERHRTIIDPIDRELFVYSWEPEPNAEGTPVRGIVQIVHGMAEHAGRYRHVAQRLAADGYAVYAGDLRGHGRSRGRYWGDLGDDGFRWMAHNAKQIADAAVHEQGDDGLPVYLIGHSMGTFVAQLTTLLYPDRYKGLLLSAAGYKKGPMLAIGEWVARLELAFRSDEGRPSALLDWLTFHAYNRDFRPLRTKCDWISSDEEQVDRYIADEQCGYVMPASFYKEFMRGLRLLYTPDLWSKLNRSMPIRILAGDKDPMSLAGKEIDLLQKAYEAAGVERLEAKLYPGMRHEIFNERDRAIVLNDVAQWLQRC